VFGFKRMHGFLSTSPNDTVLSIHKDLEAWQLFLTSSDLVPRSDLMALVIQVLGVKICSENVTLLNLQLEILLRTFVEEFRAKITEQCTAICMGTSTTTSRRNYNS